ncbi:DUF6680 family protein [Consotaella aegiceratis]|uniref:DUF6680 family protein n=1 Tax=Consotaella aegiceratis TaxID=3097961 RepID=UPI002F3E74D4
MNNADFWTFQAKDIVSIGILIITAWAVYYGPIRAVRVSRQEEQAASRTRQKAEIFASLMKTRRFQLDAEHVAALNLIQVYFSDEEAVLTAYKGYIRLLSRRSMPGVADESFWKERDDAFIDLVSQIARALGYPQDKKEIEELAYSPEGWATDQATIRKLHGLLIDIFEHRRAFPVVAASPSPPSVFPPAPVQE